MMTRWFRLALYLLFLLTAWTAATAIPLSPSWGQEDAAQAAAAAPAEEGAVAAPAEKSSVGLLILNSNAIGMLFYVALAAFSIFALAVALERMVNLTRRKVIPPEFVQALRDLVARENDTAENLLNLAERSKSPIAEILKSAALRAGRPLPEVEKAMEDATAREVAALRGRHRGLSVAGNIAPLIGLHGTVVGMIFAFQEASDMGLGKGEALAHGIYLALFTTAIGLTIAIPALLCVAWFNGRIERFLREIDQELQMLYPSFVRMERDEEGSRPWAVGSGKE
jgi:biopolymer transport protein ExbB